MLQLQPQLGSDTLVHEYDRQNQEAQKAYPPKAFCLKLSSTAASARLTSILSPLNNNSWQQVDTTLFNSTKGVEDFMTDDSQTQTRIPIAAQPRLICTKGCCPQPLNGMRHNWMSTHNHGKLCTWQVQCTPADDLCSETVPTDRQANGRPCTAPSHKTSLGIPDKATKGQLCWI